jgi:hypothetical protein
MAETHAEMDGSQVDSGDALQEASDDIAGYSPSALREAPEAGAR